MLYKDGPEYNHSTYGVKVVKKADMSQLKTNTVISLSRSLNVVKKVEKFLKLTAAFEFVVFEFVVFYNFVIL